MTEVLPQNPEDMLTKGKAFVNALRLLTVERYRLTVDPHFPDERIKISLYKSETPDESLMVSETRYRVNGQKSISAGRSYLGPG